VTNADTVNPLNVITPIANAGSLQVTRVAVGWVGAESCKFLIDGARASSSTSA